MCEAVCVSHMCASMHEAVCACLVMCASVMCAYVHEAVCACLVVWSHTGKVKPGVRFRSGGSKDCKPSGANHTDFMTPPDEPPTLSEFACQETRGRDTLHPQWSRDSLRDICCWDWHEWQWNICPASTTKLELPIYTKTNLLGGSWQQNEGWNHP